MGLISDSMNHDQMYLDQLKNDAQTSYPFIKAHDPVLTIGNGEGYAETWQKDEEGAPDQPRPYELPMDKLGIEIRNPKEFSHHDLAGEVLHADEYANSVRDKLHGSLTDKQKAVLKEEALDYEQSIKEGMSEKDAWRNATDSAMRGYTLNQFPEETNKRINYNAEQLKMLDGLRSYMTTGKKPKE